MPHTTDAGLYSKKGGCTLGRRMISPEGVNTNTPRPSKSSVMQSTNSRADRLFTNSLCQSRMEFSQLMRRAMTCWSSLRAP